MASPRPLKIAGMGAREDALESLAQAVRRGGLLEGASSGVVMVSGGADSACLAAALSRAVGPEHVHALHVNYGLRDSADRDERVCRDLCSRLRIDLHIDRPQHLEGNLQSAARDFRYAAAERLRVRTGGDWIATGHTRTDLAETLVYRLAVHPRAGALPFPAAHDGPGRRPPPRT